MTARSSSTILACAALVGCASPTLEADRIPLQGGGVARVVVTDIYHPPGVVGRATIREDGPLVELTERWVRLPPELQWFVLAHEVCHLELVSETEADADCCALSRLGTRDLPVVVGHYQDRGDTVRAVELLTCQP